MAYLTALEFKGLTLAPASYADAIEQREPGWLDRRLEYWSRHIDARLRKRYAVPFVGPPYPLTVAGWLERIVTWDVLLKRGIDATDEHATQLQASATAAHAEVAEAADTVTGLFDLPLRDDADGSAVSKAGPLFESEQSPYEWACKQLEAVRG